MDSLRDELQSDRSISSSPAGDDAGGTAQRRRFLVRTGGVIAAAAATGLFPGIVRAQENTPGFAYVGCYTTEKRSGHGKGIGVFRMDAATGAWAPLQLLDGIENPSFLALDRRQRFLYAVHGDATYATAFAIDPQTGKLTELNRQPTGGTNPVHLAVDPGNRFLVVSNYSSGSVAVLPINPDGTLAALSHLVPLPGEPGPHRTEQASSHPHQNPFDPNGRFILVPDKGLDKIFVFRFDAEQGKLVAAEKPWVTTRQGAGPRHVDFHPRLPYVYAINELDSTMTTYRFDRARGELTPMQILPTLPSDFTGNNATAEVAVHPSGRFVFGSNRGHNSIATYFVDRSTGLLATVGWESTQGKTPRFFGLDPTGMLLFAANQDSDTVVSFRVDQSTGKLTPTGHTVQTGSPVTIVFR